ncbi:hypothetical protein GCM10023339_20890 [Alloalcanivorax gelatiniphagus]
MSVSTRFGALAATAALALGGAFVAPTAAADEEPAPAPCASEQTKVDKAEDALVKVTAVFARQEARVAKVKEAVAKAEAGREKAAARRALAAAKQELRGTKTTQRAQQQRLLKAQERLTACEAAQVPAPAPTTTAATV